MYIYTMSKLQIVFFFFFMRIQIEPDAECVFWHLAYINSSAHCILYYAFGIIMHIN